MPLSAARGRWTSGRVLRDLATLFGIAFRKPTAIANCFRLGPAQNTRLPSHETCSRSPCRSTDIATDRERAAYNDVMAAALEATGKFQRTLLAVGASTKWACLVEDHLLPHAPLDFFKPGTCPVQAVRKMAVAMGGACGYTGVPELLDNVHSGWDSLVATHCVLSVHARAPPKQRVQSLCNIFPAPSSIADGPSRSRVPVVGTFALL